LISRHSEGHDNVSEVQDNSTTDADGDLELAERLLSQASTSGRTLVGPGGLLTELTQRVLERALDAEMTDHLGYEHGDKAGIGSGNSRNGRTSKTVLTDIGPVDITVPRDRNGTFDPAIVPKRQRRLDGLNDAVISLYARGLTVRDIQAHLADIYGVEVSPDLISKVTDAVAGEITEWQNRPLGSSWAVLFVDALWVKVRDGAVTNRPVYVVVGVDFEGTKHVLGLWIGKDGEGAKYWMNLLAELRNRGVSQVCFVCTDGLSGMPEAITTIWPAAIVQTCIVHLIRASMRYSSKKHITALLAALRPIYQAPTVAAAETALEAMEAGEIGQRYPAIPRSWRAAWDEFTPFLAYPPEIRKVLYTTNMIESLNARLRKATRNRGAFPSEQAALKTLYLTVRTMTRPDGSIGITRSNGWLSRPGARSRHCCRPVSPGRSPNRTCPSPGIRLSTVGCVRRGVVAGTGWESSRPGSGNG
jgi:putative transposase